MADEVKYFVLLKGGKDTEHIYSGKQPRQAALKAATRGLTDIKLRERSRRNRDGTYSIHIFKGSRKKVSISPEVSWLPGSVWKPVVKKVKVDRVKSIK